MTELARDEIAADAIELPGERTKNGLPHTIPITPMIRRVLEYIATRPVSSCSMVRIVRLAITVGRKTKVAPAIRALDAP